MARLLVQLKLRLLRNGLRASRAAKVAFILSTTFAVLVAAGTFTVLALLRGHAAAVDVTAVIFTVFAFGWLILPIFAFGLDSTLDPATLALYPLRTRPLAAGLLAASASGAWPGSARPWPRPTSSPSCCPIPWTSELAAPCPRPPRDMGRTRSGASSAPWPPPR